MYRRGRQGRRVRLLKAQARQTHFWISLRQSLWDTEIQRGSPPAQVSLLPPPWPPPATCPRSTPKVLWNPFCKWVEPVFAKQQPSGDGWSAWLGFTWIRSKLPKYLRPRVCWSLRVLAHPLSLCGLQVAWAPICAQSHRDWRLWKWSFRMEMALGWHCRTSTGAADRVILCSPLT